MGARDARAQWAGRRPIGPLLLGVFSLEKRALSDVGEGFRDSWVLRKNSDIRGREGCMAAHRAPCHIHHLLSLLSLTTVGSSSSWGDETSVKTSRRRDSEHTGGPIHKQ